MFVIAGLGNPGKKYENTRHNMGFITVDQLAEKHNIKVDKIKFKALVGEGRIAGQKVLLVKPQTYMNLSGESIREVMNFYKLEPENLIVIYDDMDIEPGKIKIRKKGSSGGHNGMKSIIQMLGTEEFSRIRIGIGRPKHNGDEINYVIGAIQEDQIPILEEGVKKAKEAVIEILKNGIDSAMNKLN